MSWNLLYGCLKLIGTPNSHRLSFHDLLLYKYYVCLIFVFLYLCLECVCDYNVFPMLLVTTEELSCHTVAANIACDKLPYYYFGIRYLEGSLLLHTWLKHPWQNYSHCNHWDWNNHFYYFSLFIDLLFCLWSITNCREKNSLLFSKILFSDFLSNNPELKNIQFNIT